MDVGSGAMALQWRSEDHSGRRCCGAEKGTLLASLKSKPLLHSVRRNDHDILLEELGMVDLVTDRCLNAAPMGPDVRNGPLACSATRPQVQAPKSGPLRGPKPRCG